MMHKRIETAESSSLDDFTANWKSQNTTPFFARTAQAPGPALFLILMPQSTKTLYPLLPARGHRNFQCCTGQVLVLPGQVL